MYKIQLGIKLVFIALYKVWKGNVESAINKPVAEFSELTRIDCCRKKVLKIKQHKHRRHRATTTLR